MYKYAQIDCCGFVVWLRTFPEQVDEEDMIPVGEDFDPAGKRWNGTDWETYEPEPEPIRPDKTQADMDYLKMMIGGAAE